MMKGRGSICLGAFFVTILAAFASDNNINGFCESDDCKDVPITETTENDCFLAGKWKNELDSMMIITGCANGYLFGNYNSKVGEASSWYKMVGRYTVTKENGEPTAIEVGWTVSWNNNAFGNSNSVTTWSGICYRDTMKIYTQWILTRYQKPDDLWQSAMINRDIFTQVD